MLLAIVLKILLLLVLIESTVLSHVVIGISLCPPGLPTWYPATSEIALHPRGAILTHTGTMFLVQDFFLILGNSLQCSVYRKTMVFAVDKMPQFVNFSLSLSEKVKVFSVLSVSVSLATLLAACGIIGPDQELNPCPLCWAWNLNPWTARKYLVCSWPNFTVLSQDSHGDSVMIACCVIWSSYLCVSSASEFLSGVQPEEHPLAFIVVRAVSSRCPWVLSTWECFHFALVFEGYCLQMEILSWQIFILPQHFKDVVPLSSFSIDLWFLAVWWQCAQT